MARIETWFNQDLQQAVKVQYIDGNVFSADNQGNVVGVNVFDGGEPATLGGTVSANVIRADGATVAVTGTLSGNKCSVILPQSAYAVPGVISIVIKLTSGSDITTVCAVVGNVYMSTTDSVVDPGTIIPSVETLIAEIEAAIASIPADYSSLWQSLAPTFNTGTSYSVGDYVTYEGHLYRFVYALFRFFRQSPVCYSIVSLSYNKRKARCPLCQMKHTFCKKQSNLFSPKYPKTILPPKSMSCA
jgi:hypothetical protein